MQVEAVDGCVFDVVEDEGGAEIGGGDLEANVLEGEAFDSAGVEAVGGHGAHHEVLAGDLWEVAAGCVFGCPATAEGKVDVVEGDVFHDGSADTVEGDAGVLFAGVGGAGDFGFG